MAKEFIWRGSAFAPFDRDEVGDLLVADSWRSEAGRVAAFGSHIARFEDAVGRVSRATFNWDAVWHGVAHIILNEAEASLFPRISLEAAGLVLAIRPCPPARAQTTLTVFDGPDPRLTPQIKGPDIPRLAAANATTITDDIILRDADGALVEASAGALVHWLDGKIVISNRFDRQLASVTLWQVYDRAITHGIPATFDTVTTDDLGHGPMWFVNAVHGVSPVSEISVGDAVVPIPEHPDAAEWRAWWWGTLAPISESLRDEAERMHPSLANAA